jgi:hypothetical protein
MTWGEVVDELLDEVGDALRYVARYDEAGYDRLYVRGDVQDRRERAAFENVYVEARFEGEEKAYLEERLDSGRLRSTLHSFDDLLLFNLISGPAEGLLVTLDRDADVHLGSFLTRFESHGSDTPDVADVQ